MAHRERVKSEADVTTRWTTLQSRFSRWHRLMEDLDPWRHLDKERLYDTIWKSNAPKPEQLARWTIVKPDICSVTDTVTSFLTARRPKIMVTPRNTIVQLQGDQVNLVERIGYAVHDTIDRERMQSLISELGEYDIHRGAMVTKVLWLSPEERGEERETTPVDVTTAILDPAAEPITEEIVVKEGSFPVYVENIDPLECVWTIGRGGRVTELVHHYKAPFDYLLDIYPDLDTHEGFRDTQFTVMGNNPVDVYDYWTEDVNAIVIQGRFYKKPTDHGYGRVPFVVTLCKPRLHRYHDNGTAITEGTPFCASMVESIRHLAWAESLEAAHLEYALHHVVVLENVDPDDSMHITEDENGDPKFSMEIDNRPGGSLLATTANKHGGERLRQPLQSNPAPLVQEYKGTRARDAALTSFQEGILTGAYNIDLSGVSVAQQKQAAMARVAPYEVALNQHLSNVYANVLDLFRNEWDHSDDAEITLVRLVGQEDQPEEELKVSKETFEAVGTVRVTIDLEVPTNREQEWTLLFQALSQGVATQRQVIEQMGISQDPTATIEEIIYERYIASDPALQAAIAMKVAKRNGVQPLQPKPQTPAPQGMPPGMPMDPAAMGMGGGMPMGAPPMDPAMAAMGGGMPPMDPAMMAAMGGGAPPMGGAPGGELPPELMQMLMQMQGAGPMQAGG